MKDKTINRILCILVIALLIVVGCAGAYAGVSYR